MYIFELIFKFFRRKKKYNTQDFEPITLKTDGLIEDSNECMHLFMPLDSSNEFFACKHCGLVVPKKELKNKNIFENKSF